MATIAANRNVYAHIDYSDCTTHMEHDNIFDWFQCFCMTYEHYVAAVLLEKNHVYINFELKQ